MPGEASATPRGSGIPISARREFVEVGDQQLAALVQVFDARGDVGDREHGAETAQLGIQLGGDFSDRKRAPAPRTNSNSRSSRRRCVARTTSIRRYTS